MVVIQDWSSQNGPVQPNETTVDFWLNEVLVRTILSTDDVATAAWGDSEGDFWKVATIEWPSGIITPIMERCTTGNC